MKMMKIRMFLLFQRETFQLKNSMPTHAVTHSIQVQHTYLVQREHQHEDEQPNAALENALENGGLNVEEAGKMT